MTDEVLLSLDWVGLSLRMVSDPIDIPNHIWREYSATNVWGKRRILYTENGDKILTLLYEPRSKIIAYNAALLEIENEWLYHGLGIDGVLHLLDCSMRYEILGFSRLDLCADFCPDKQKEDIIKGLANGQYYVGGKRNGSQFWSTNNNKFLAAQWNNIKIPHCQSWGHKTSQIKWKLYYKTKELADAGGGKFMEKPYIIDQWRMASMDIDNVWRLEVSLKHGNGFMFDGMKLDLDMLREKRADVFLALYNKRFVVRKEEGHVDKSNDTIVPFLNVKGTTTIASTAEAKKLAEHSGRISLLRHLVKSLDDEQVLLDRASRQDVLAHMKSLIKRDGLQNYFNVMTGYWFEDFAQLCEENAVSLWADRDSASPLHENKGSHLLEEQIIDVQKGKQPQMHPNTAFDDTQSNNLQMYNDWLSAKVPHSSDWVKPPDPQQKIDFSAE